MRIRPLRVLVIACAVALLPAGLAAADGDGHGHGTGEYDPPGESDPCPLEEQGVYDFEERYDEETGRRECVVFYHPTEGDDTWGSWDPEHHDDDPNYTDPDDGSNYSPGDRSTRWGMNKENEEPEPGQTDGTGAEIHYGYHDPVCSQEAQDILLADVRASLDRYDGAEGFQRATEEGYIVYPIGGKTWHAYNSAYYDDSDENGVQRDNDPWFPENIVYAMTDHGWKAMGAMFALGTAEQHIDPATGQPKEWKDVDSSLWPQWTKTYVNSAGVEVTETCQMNWHTHAGAGGTATGGGLDPQSAESHPMSHVWAWGVDMWERGFDGTEYNSWFVVWRTLPAICSEYDSCL